MTSTEVRSGIEPRRLMLTLACSPCSLQPNTSADRFATLPRICSRVDSSLIPSRSYESILSSVAAASAASLERTSADNASRLFSVFTEISEGNESFISRFTFVTPSRLARLQSVVLFTFNLSAIASHSIPARYRLQAFCQTSFGILISNTVRTGKESRKESDSPILALSSSQSFSLVFLSNSTLFPPCKTFSNFFFDSFTCPPHAVRREQNLASKTPLPPFPIHHLRCPRLRVLLPFHRLSILNLQSNHQ